MAVEAYTVAMLAVAHEPDMRGSVLTFDVPQGGTVRQLTFCSPPRLTE